MGTSASTEQKEVSSEQREVEATAASTGALPALQKAFAKLAHPQTNVVPIQSLQQCFISYKNPICEASLAKAPDSLLTLPDHLGSSIVDLFFMPEKGGLNWVEFMRGYVNCCARMTASMRLTNLLRVFSVAAEKAGVSVKLEFEADEDACKVGGYLVPSDVFGLLLICWSMSWSARCSRNASKEGETFYVPDFNNLVLSATVACAEGGSALDVWNCDIFNLDLQIAAGKFLTWALATVPGIPDCFSQFVFESLHSCVPLEQHELEQSSSPVGDVNVGKDSDSHLLTCGRAWAISLAFRSTASAEILRHCFPTNGDEIKENLLYWSSVHGKGLNRFWANIEGYHGPLLILISAVCGDSPEDNSGGNKWIIGALLQQGFENRDHFYGNSGYLYAIDPLFNVILPSGKENNFVYSHLHPTGKVYEPHPKPVGIAFGGTVGNERIFIDEDFARVTIRHHAVDKTYQPGPLFPNQGFLPIDASIQEVEVWGLGGARARDGQSSYKKREQLFTEQRRKVDLKTFTSWEDSPEKMMMDMVSDPNIVRREDR